MDLEFIRLSEISQKKKNTVINFMWNLKNEMNVCNKTERDPQIQRINQCSPLESGEMGGEMR